MLADIWDYKIRPFDIDVKVCPNTYHRAFCAHSLQAHHIIQSRVRGKDTYGNVVGSVVAETH